MYKDTKKIQKDIRIRLESIKIQKSKHWELKIAINANTKQEQNDKTIDLNHLD